MKESLFVGDIHGDLNQLIYPLFDFLDDMDKYERIVFLGDYVDRGESNAYIYLILNFFINEPEFKDKIIFLCGNHDVWPAEFAEGFSPYIKSIHDSRKWGYTTKSFIFENLKQLPFQLAYYNKNWNILFTHSQQVKTYGKWHEKEELSIKGLDERLAETRLNENNMELFKKYTWFDWYGPAGTERTYRNICGHCHYFDDVALDKLFNNKLAIASIDSDSSYFFRPLITSTHYYKNLEPSWESFVRYISIPDDGKSWRNHQITIKFYNDKSRMNYNLCSFNELKMQLISHLTNPKVKQDFLNNFQLQQLIEIFEKRFKEEFNKKYVEENIIKNYENKCEKHGYSIVYPVQEIEFDDNDEIKLTEYNIKRCIKYRHDFDNRKSNVYFNDVPIDVYHHYGIFKNETVNDIGKLYCMVVWGDLWYKAWILQFNHTIIKDKVYNDSCLAIHPIENEEPKLDGAFMKNKLLLFIEWIIMSLFISLIVILIVISPYSQSLNNNDIHNHND